MYDVLHLALHICKELGVPVALEKVKGPVTVLDFLGIILDAVKMELRLPSEKLSQLRNMPKELHHHLRLNVATRLDLHWWKFFLEHWNGVGIMPALSKHPPEVMVTSDASGHCGL